MQQNITQPAASQHTWKKQHPPKPQKPCPFLRLSTCTERERPGAPSVVDSSETCLHCLFRTLRLRSPGNQVPARQHLQLADAPHGARAGWAL